MGPALLLETLEARMTAVAQALEHLTSGGNPAAEIENVRAQLVEILQLVARDPGIHAAADDLCSCARAYAAAEADEPGGIGRRKRLLTEAYSQLWHRLGMAHLGSDGVRTAPE
ncbi:hypothetical protein [Methylobacterium sp. WSM2598]|uniref:hypothetical protein n=1 Tax=Methylobacterium sp. WSM2598 TaxID=398261 RepID=UPI00035FC51A|nr:hypothetical protein [Methylobacterium sp. WSM2598]